MKKKDFTSLIYTALKKNKLFYIYYACVRPLTESYWGVNSASDTGKNGLRGKVESPSVSDEKKPSQLEMDVTENSRSGEKGRKQPHSSGFWHQD